MLVIAAIIGTFLRISLLVIYPALTVCIAAYLKLRLSGATIILTLLAAASFALSLLPSLHLRYNLLSLFYMVPLLILLFARLPLAKPSTINYTEVFAGSLASVAVVNDIIGLIQVFRHPNSDDSFMGIYSGFSVSLNGLMLYNTVVFFYYFVRYLDKRKTLYLAASIFFLVSATLCFYGAGLLICLAAFILVFFRMNLLAVFRTFFISSAAILVIYYLMLIIKPDTLRYNVDNIKKLAGIDKTSAPRKILSFSNYFHAYPADVKDFLFGSGPGTFNSRTAFMIGSPSYFTAGAAIKDPDQPYYFKNYAYPLWNSTNTSQAQYLDGFRNQPFSSLLAFLGEYGLIFTLSFFLFYYRMYRQTAYYNSRESDRSGNWRFQFFKFLAILLPLLFVIDNYFEYPEIVLLLAIGMKTAQLDLMSNYHKSLAHAA